MARIAFWRKPRALAVEQRALPVTTDPDATIAAASGYRQYSVTEGIEIAHARALAAENPWVRAAISRLKSKVIRAERAILPIDPMRPHDKQLQARLTYLLENPNPRGDSWRSFIEPLVEDYLVIGKAGFEYVNNFKGWPLALFPFNAEFMHLDPSWDGRNQRAPRYVWRPRGMTEVWLGNHEITLMLDNPTTHRAEGWSKLAILRKTVEADAAADQYVRGMLEKYPPPGWVYLGERATARQVKEFAQSYKQQVAGRGGLMVTGNHTKPELFNFFPHSSSENELRAWSEYFARKVAICFGLSPLDLGITSDINRSTASAQSDISAEDGAISLLMLLEDYWNREVIGKHGTPETVNLALRFKDVTMAEREKRAAMVQKLAGTMPVIQLNELRVMADMPPIAGGNAIYIVTRQGVVSVLGEDAARPLAQAEGIVGASEQAEGEAGEKPGEPSSAEQEDVAGNKGPTGAPSATEAEVDAKESEAKGRMGTPAENPQGAGGAQARSLLAAYLRMWSGGLNWGAQLDPEAAADMLAFVRGHLVARREARTDFFDPAQVRDLDNYRRHLDRTLSLPGAATGPLPAYRVLGMVERAA